MALQMNNSDSVHYTAVWVTRFELETICSTLSGYGHRQWDLILFFIVFYSLCEMLVCSQAVRTLSLFQNHLIFIIIPHLIVSKVNANELPTNFNAKCLMCLLYYQWTCVRQSIVNLSSTLHITKIVPITEILFTMSGGGDFFEFFWLRFWNLRYFFVSFVKILRFYKNNFLIGPLLGEVRFFRVVLGLRGMRKNFELCKKKKFFFFNYGP